METQRRGSRPRPELFVRVCALTGSFAEMGSVALCVVTNTCRDVGTGGNSRLEVGKPKDSRGLRRWRAGWAAGHESCRKRPFRHLGGVLGVQTGTSTNWLEHCFQKVFQSRRRFRKIWNLHAGEQVRAPTCMFALSICNTWISDRPRRRKWRTEHARVFLGPPFISTLPTRDRRCDARVWPKPENHPESASREPCATCMATRLTHVSRARQFGRATWARSIR